MLSLDLAIFLCGTVTAAFVTSLSGFAFGVVAAAIWFYALEPPQASALIPAYALLVQGRLAGQIRTWRGGRNRQPVTEIRAGLTFAISAQKDAMQRSSRLALPLMTLNRQAR